MPSIIPRWSFNIGYLLAHQIAEGGGAWVSCSRCKTWTPVDLAGLVLKKGPLFSLWNRRPPCPSCKSPMSFHAHHAPGARVWPLHTDNPKDFHVMQLHRAWENERRRMLGMTPI